LGAIGWSGNKVDSHAGMVTPVLTRLNGTDGLFRDPTGGNGLIAEILQLLKITPTRLSTFARDESWFWTASG